MRMCSARGKNDGTHKCFGSKNAGAARQIADICDRIPRNIYVEPFLGYGAVYRMMQPTKVEILNDKDCKRVSQARGKSCQFKNKVQCERIKKARVSCRRDYGEFLKRFDRKGVFMYLDPPFHNKKASRSENYDHNTIDFEQFVQRVKAVKKASLAVSYSDTPEARAALCNIQGFKCHKIKKNVLSNWTTELLAVKQRR